MTYALSLVVCAKYIFLIITHTQIISSQHTCNASRHRPITIYHNILPMYRHLLQYTLYPNLSRYTPTNHNASHHITNLQQVIAIHSSHIAPYRNTPPKPSNLLQPISNIQQPIATCAQYTVTYRDMLFMHTPHTTIYHNTQYIIPCRDIHPTCHNLPRYTPHP